MKRIYLQGDHYTMGFQHGDQVQGLRPLILQAMQERLSRLEQLPLDLHPLAMQLESHWTERNQPTLEMLRGISRSLALDWEPYFTYTVASYLTDRASQPAPDQGCTVWAAAGQATRDGQPMLVKNRDYRPDHQALQYLAQVQPRQGCRYAYVTSAGSPGVFSSGMNEAGLAIADTHVSALDSGAGLPRYSAMMAVLERCESLPEALEYLHSVPHLGDGTLVLVDRSGEMAVFEAGHRAQGVIHPQEGFVVSTNHFTTPALVQRWRDRSPQWLRGNTKARYARVSAALRSGVGQVDVPWAQALMASHGSPLDAICRHAELEPQSVTISSVIFLPRSAELLVTDGPPCRSAYLRLPVVSEN